MIKSKLALIGLFSLSSCGVSSQGMFTDFYNKEKACDYLNVDTVKSVLSIEQDITKEAQFSDSFFNGYMGAWCELSWNDKNDETHTITFILTKPKSQDVFPPIKLSEKQLVSKINQANKSMESYTSHYDKSMIKLMEKNNNDSIRNTNDYQLIDNLGDSATLTKIVTNNDDFNQSMAGDLIKKQDTIITYILSVKSEDFILKISSSAKDILKNTQETLKQIAQLILREN